MEGLMQKLSRLFRPPYTVAVLAVTLAVPPALLLAPFKPSPTSMFLGAVMVSAWYGGLGPGLLATALSALAFDLLFLPPVYSPEVAVSDGMRLLVFVGVSALISLLNAARKRVAEGLLAQARRKDDFLATLAHELRNPLSPITHALHALRLRSGDALTVERARDIMERQVRQLSRLIEDLLDVARLSRGKARLCKEPVDVAAAVAQAVETTRPVLDARRHRLEVETPAAPLVLEVDPGRLQQILVNLLTNAARYTEPGGHIGMTAGRVDGEVVLRVRDSGIGLAAEVLPHIFEPFVQAEDGVQGGLGVGLSLVRGLVELHGGRITAASAGPGQGSEFTVRLPAPVEPRRPRQHGGLYTASGRPGFPA
jgi:signal transduction histidine kinase